MTDQTSAEAETKDSIVADLATGGAPASGGADGKPADAALHQIVVIGGGAAGLELATRLGDTLGRSRKRRATIALVDRARSHLWKPLLHARAAGTLDVDEY